MATQYFDEIVLRTVRCVTPKLVQDRLTAMGKRTAKGAATMAVAYIRVSTDEQRLGPEAQRAAIEVWAAREGVQVAAWHVDAGVSGATRRRRSARPRRRAGEPP